MLLEFNHYIIMRGGNRIIFTDFKTYKPFSILVREGTEKHREYRLWITISKEISVSFIDIFLSGIELGEGEFPYASITKFKNKLTTAYNAVKYKIYLE